MNEKMAKKILKCMMIFLAIIIIVLIKINTRVIPPSISEIKRITVIKYDYLNNIELKQLDIIDNYTKDKIINLLKKSKSRLKLITNMKVEDYREIREEYRVLIERENKKKTVFFIEPGGNCYRILFESRLFDGSRLYIQFDNKEVYLLLNDIM